MKIRVVDNQPSQQILDHIEEVIISGSCTGGIRITAPNPGLFHKPMPNFELWIERNRTQQDGAFLTIVGLEFAES